MDGSSANTPTKRTRQTFFAQAANQKQWMDDHYQQHAVSLEVPNRWLAQAQCCALPNAIVRLYVRLHTYVLQNNRTDKYVCKTSSGSSDVVVRAAMSTNHVRGTLSKTKKQDHHKMQKIDELHDQNSQEIISDNKNSINNPYYSYVQSMCKNYMIA